LARQLNKKGRLRPEQVSSRTNTIIDTNTSMYSAAREVIEYHRTSPRKQRFLCLCTVHVHQSVERIVL